MKRRILLVDDDLAVLLTLKAVLELHGFEVETAASTAEAFSRMESGVYHMVISDLRMETEEAGLEVIRAARRQSYDPATALLTAFPPSGRMHVGTQEADVPTRCWSNRSAPAIWCARSKPCSSATPTSSNSAPSASPAPQTQGRQPQGGISVRWPSVAIVFRIESGARDLPPLLKTLAAQHRPSLGRTERHRRLFAALRAVRAGFGFRVRAAREDRDPSTATRLPLQFLQRLGSFLNCLSWKNSCSPAVNTKSVPQSMHFRILSWNSIEEALPFPVPARHGRPE